MDIFTGGLGALVASCAVLHYYTRSTAVIVKDPSFSRFQQVYLIVYMLAMRNKSLSHSYILK